MNEVCQSPKSHGAGQVNSTRSCFQESLIPDIVKMVASNIFRALPAKARSPLCACCAYAAGQFQQLWYIPGPLFDVFVGS